MLLEIDNFEQFKVFFDAIYDITDLIELQLFKTHMVCSILDKAHVRFMSVTFQSDFFSSYEIDDAESVTLFAEDLHKIIKSASKIDTVTLMTNEDHLVCKFESNNGNSRVFEFVLPADYIESPQPPSLSLPISFELNLSDLKQGIKDLKIIGSSEIQFNVSNDLLALTSGIETTTNYSSNIPITVECEYPISARYTMDYIEQILKFEKINKVGRIQLNGDMPFVYEIEDEIMGIKVNGMIAPRTEVE